ncbi:kinase-like protein [Byssothecium circinans]|uniref:Kinase-like protein n=1 Tax=Byssothecium circinans TaxID=147558 RepID=A0A6A5TZC9_9PLEO|nr:kinase-like protein [Byssothecium circinans]
MPTRSLFRRPSESSSSDDSSDHREDASHDAPADNLLSRINTIDTSSSAAPVGLPGIPATVQGVTTSRSNSQLRDILMHSLLEEKTLRDTAERLGKDQSDPEVQQVAKSAYQGIVHQILDSEDHKYASDAMEHARAAAKEGINRVTRAQFNGISGDMNAVGTAAAAGVSQALVPRPLNVVDTGVEAITANLDLALGLRVPIPPYLHGLHGLHTDRYARDYTEIEMVGKGGYGKVYKVKHKLDNSFYAVKRIIVSPAKIRTLTEGNRAQEMENMLKEVRSLAQLDHVNIVRYFNAWLEYCPSGDAVLPGQFLNDERTDASTSSAYGASYGEPDQYSDMGIVFEDSDTGAGAEQPLDVVNDLPLSEVGTKRRDRRTSEATITSISSLKSRGSAIAQIIHEDESDDDIEVIPRTFEESSSFMSDSDMPNQLVSTRHNGSYLTLNIQMSLYEGNLSSFLSSEKLGPTHCFHTCISLELLNSIIDGVEYLHSEGVVHRDLKPANVFLSLASSRRQPVSSVDLSTCRHCPSRECLYVTPRIGDFGLVAVLGDSAASKPVGTEFYRPPSGGMVSEKLDVYALGVVAFELLQSFGTRMERIEALTNLRRGELPEGFGEIIGGYLGRKVEGLLVGMLRDDEEMRWGCEQVKSEVEKIVSGYKA